MKRSEKIQVIILGIAAAYFFVSAFIGLVLQQRYYILLEDDTYAYETIWVWEKKELKEDYKYFLILNQKGRVIHDGRHDNGN